MVSPNITILFLATNPSDAPLLRLDKELRDIRNTLNSDKFKLESRGAVRARDMLEAILDVKPQIVHLSGHGTETGEFCLEDDQGQSQPVQPQALAELFKLVSEDVKCVVINSCYSEEQVKAIADHIAFVIGMKTSITDRAAIEFATGFYTALGRGESTEKAYGFGRVALQLKNIQEHSIPILMFGDPKKRFRAEVEQHRPQLEGKNFTFINTYRLALEERGIEMKLSSEEANLIIDEVFELIQDIERKKNIYKQALINAIQEEFPLSEESREALQFLLKYLKLQNEEVNSLEQQIISNPNWQTPKAFVNRGITQVERKNYQKAIEYYTKAIELQPQYSHAYLERAIAYDELRNKKDALADYDQAITINNNWDDLELATAFYERGNTYSFLEEFQAAIDDYSQAIALKRDYFKAYVERGYCYYRLKNRESAIEDYDKAIRMSTWENNSLARAYLDRGLVYYYLFNNKQAALDDWNEVIKFRPTYSLAYYNRGHLNSDLGKKQEAIEDYTKAIETNNDWGTGSLKEAYLKRGKLYYELGDINSASKDFQRAGTSLELELHNPTLDGSDLFWFQ